MQSDPHCVGASFLFVGEKEKMKHFGFKRWLPTIILGLVPICVALAAGDPVLVSRPDMTLTKSDFEAALSAIPKEKRDQMSPSVKQTMIFLEKVMVFRKLAQEGHELGLDRDPVIQKEVQQAAERALGIRRIETFEAALKLPDFTAAALERYETKKSEFLIPEAVSASHVLVRAEGRSDEEAKRRAEEVRAKAVAGADFQVLVKEYSDDPSKANNSGELGMFERSTKEKPGMVKPFEDAAFALKKPGEISPLVKTQFGYHVIRLTEKRPAKQKYFEEVKESLVKSLHDKFVTDAKAAYISAIKNDKSIVVHEDVIEAMNKE